MITKITLTIDINPETLECKILKQDTSTSTKKATKIEEGVEPKIILEANKFILNQAAADLIGVQPEDRVAIRYKKIDKVLFPVIGKQEAFKISSGNRVTKGLSVSCRGVGNEELSKYGSTFTLTSMKDNPELFVMVGDTDISESNNNDIDTSTEDEAPEEDINDITQQIDENDSFNIDNDSFNI